jgi:hypothetical protein
MTFAQNFERIIFDYNKLRNDDQTTCSSESLDKLEEIFHTLEKQKTQEALKLSKQVFEAKEKCPRIFETHAWALFRNGEWLESIQIIDMAITLYGANPDLIIRRAYMSFEMAELGIGSRIINGKSVYLSAGKYLPFDEENFKHQNYLAALTDFKFIADNFIDRNHEIFITGYLFSKLDNDEGSNFYLAKLMNNPEYQEEAADLIVDNRIAKGEINEAEEILLSLAKKHPKNPGIYRQLSKIYKAAGIIDQHNLYKNMYEFYRWMPSYLTLEYSNENFQLIQSIITEKSSEEKLEIVENLAKRKDRRLMDVLIVHLHHHKTHDDEFEEAIQKSLIKIGKPTVPALLQLLNASTEPCSIEKAAYILAEIKDTSAWFPMVDYLNKIERNFKNTTPPNIPEQLIRFNKQKALIEILKWIKPRLHLEDNNDSTSMNDPGINTISIIKYKPLIAYSKNEIEKAAISLGYQKRDIERLMNKIQAY